MTRCRLFLMFLIAASGGVAGCGTAVLDPIQGSGGTLEIDVLAHWTFDEGAGNLIQDSSQNRHDGTLIGGGGSVWVPGQRGFGSALYLKRGDHIPTTDSFPAATPNWTVSLWVRFQAGDLATGRSPLIGNEGGSGGWEVNAPDDSMPPKLEFAYPTMGGGPPGGGPNHLHVLCCQSPPIDRWIHVTAVQDGHLNTLTIYEGSVEVQVNRMLPSLIRPGSTTLTIGTDNPNQGANLFQGTVDEIRIYDRALSQTDISTLNTKP